jgi:indole-3-glycerol phosphate synthase
MSNILNEIVEHKKADVAKRKVERSLRDIDATLKSVSKPRGFLAALTRAVARGDAAVIAECKKASPSKGVIRERYDPASIAASYQNGGATCLSVLTDERYFQGTDGHLLAAREASNLPVIRKDFVIDAYQIYEARALGADCILLIAACLDDSMLGEFLSIASELGMDSLVEIHDRTELERVLNLRTPLIGINNRDLKRFTTDIETTIGLLKFIPDNRIVVTESGIRTNEDVRYLRRNDVHAFLVGEAFMQAEDPGRKLRELFFSD